jgi:hypothetical protein
MTEVIVITVLVAVAAAVAVIIGVSKHYKRGLYAPIYPLERYTNLNLTHREDRFINRTVTRVRISNSKNRD